MKILLAGGTGFIGNALSPYLQDQGHSVKKLVREKTGKEDEIYWDTSKNLLDPAECEAFDFIINLAGENIASSRWTSKVKNKIKESRVMSTRLIVETLAKVKNKPKGMINASAVGFYGNRGSEILNESDPVGEGFLAEVCREWEEEALKARQFGIRVALARFGTVLSDRGGALEKMLIPFKLGLGGKIGSGDQYMSWIAIDDLLASINFILEKEELSEGINVVSPNPVKNKDFTQILGYVLKRPTILAMPEFAAKLAFGEMADETLLSSTRVVPKKLEECGFQFSFPNLEQALQHYLEPRDVLTAKH